MKIITTSTVECVCVGGGGYVRDSHVIYIMDGFVMAVGVWISCGDCELFKKRCS